MSQSQERAFQALNRIAKWRALFAGWQLGTRPKGDPESDAVRDHREATILLRVEMTALASLLIKKGVITTDELLDAQAEEADLLEQDYREKFPGVEATDNGLTIDNRTLPWMKGWRP
jgi:hypothetical protein